MKELDAPATATGKSGSDEDTVLVDSANNNGSIKKKKGKK